jgi:hypothetical protein
MVRLWMYESWALDQEEKHKFAKDYSLFIGSFHNPDAARQIMQQENPDISLSDQEEQESMRKVLASRPIETRRQRRRRVKKVIK